MGGVDKAKLALADSDFLERALGALAPMTDRIAVAGGGPRQTSVIALTDPMPDAGPLAGIAAGLQWAEELEAEWLLTTPVDTPFLDASVYERLLAAADGAEAVIAESGGRAHWLTGVWRPTLARPARTALETGVRAVTQFLENRDFRLLTLNDPADIFLNVNTEQDLARARARLEEG